MNIVLLATAEKALELGWRLIVLEQGGKRPSGPWKGMDQLTLEEAQSAVGAGHNLGICCGDGLVVLDYDDCGPDAPPHVKTPHGWHVYCSGGEGLGNSAGKIGPGIDTRGAGGYVVAPGSVVDGEAYELLRPMGELEPLPESVARALAPTEREDVAPAGPVSGGVTAYAARALAGECAAVRGAVEGERNDRLNTAAFNLGQLVAGGELEEGDVFAELSAAGILCGLEPDEVSDTVKSGMGAGQAKPRGTPDPGPGLKLKRGELPQVWWPAKNWYLDGETIKSQKVSTRDFGMAAVELLPNGSFYRRGGVVGTIIDERFVPGEVSDLIVSVPEHMEFKQGHAVVEGGKVVEAREVYKPLDKKYAEIIFTTLKTHDSVREIEVLTPYPIFTRALELTTYGWNEADRIYQTGDEIIEPVRDRGEIFAAMNDLVDDIWIVDDASRQRYWMIFVAALMRHAINDVAPMFLISAPQADSAKTLLLKVVSWTLGIEPGYASLGDKEEEVDKRIMGLLVGGQPIIAFDNFPEHTLDSDCFARLLTATHYQGRMLYTNAMTVLPNTALVLGNASQFRATRQIARRVLPVLTSRRPDGLPFVHHPRRRWTMEVRRRVVGAACGMILNWRDAGCPLSSESIGSFERFCETVGGVMEHQGYGLWAQGLGSWGSAVDDWSADLASLVNKWAEVMGAGEVTRDWLFSVCRELELFPGAVNEQPNSRDSFGRAVLQKVKGRSVGPFTIRVKHTNLGRRYRLEGAEVMGK